MKIENEQNFHTQVAIKIDQLMRIFSFLLMPLIVFNIKFLKKLFNFSFFVFKLGTACFRRALAGKRVSPHWVRRTLTCERVEDCQTECSLERRFVCEGFNYRLDPTGQGQGICELIDVPLSEMDLYSSASRRDEVLLYHPDYDYYERDRNACRPSLCKDCKPYIPRPEPPTKYFPEPPPSSYSSGNEDREHAGGKPYLPTGPDYTQPTTYRPIDNYKPYSDSRPPYDAGSSDHHSSDRFKPPYENTAIVSE